MPVLLLQVLNAASGGLRWYFNASTGLQGTAYGLAADLNTRS